MQSVFMKSNYFSERQYQEIQKARKLWDESEWRLQFLRSETGAQPKEPTDEEVLTWARKNNAIL